MLTLMLVEDNIPFRQVFKGGLLSEFPSMRVIEAGNGEEAFKELASYPIDLIFMDIRLPGENGLELTRKIKAKYHDNPIIIVTSYDLPEYREAAIKCGADGFIGKNSIDTEIISAMIKCHREAKQKGRKPICIGLASGGVGI
jgi:DNA-binding NarL/FixJ family response regulator